MNRNEVALIVGGGPGISASCARLFAAEGMRVVIAARNIDKPVLAALGRDCDATLVRCDASSPESVAALFAETLRVAGSPRLVVHNIDGRPRDVFRKSIAEVSPAAALATLVNSTYSAFLVGQQAARCMLAQKSSDESSGDHRGTIVFTNASAAFKGFALSGAFAAASHGKRGLAESMARELMPQGIHVAHVPIDAAIGWVQEDGTRAHWLAGPAQNDNMAHPDRIAELYLQLHRQHRSTWAFEVVLRPWLEKW